MICELLAKELERFCLAVGDSAKDDAFKTDSRMGPSEWGYTAPINRFPGADCSTIAQLTDARLAGTVLPPFTFVAKEVFLTRTNGLDSSVTVLHCLERGDVASLLGPQQMSFSVAALRTWLDV